MSILTAIHEFVAELIAVVDISQSKPLVLYNRIVSKISNENNPGFSKCKNPMESFLIRYSDDLKTDKELKEFISRDVYIPYGTEKRFSIEIGKYVHAADSDTNDVIKDHLLVMSAILWPDDEHLSTLEKLQHNLATCPPEDMSPETAFISGILAKTTKALEGIDEPEDPSKAIAELISGGLLTDIMSGIQEGANGDMDLSKLMVGLQGMVGNFMNLENPANFENVMTEPHVQELDD